MRNTSKLAVAIASATLGSQVFAACPTGTTDVTASYGSALTAASKTFACEMSDITNTSVTLNDTAANLYVLAGRVDVGTSYAGINQGDAASENPGTLTIEAGALIIGDSSNDAAQDPDRLVVNRGSQAFMNGTAAAPINFTGREALEGTSTSRGQWGGVYLNGYGLNNGCDDVNLPAPASGACVRSGEAQTGSHGGNDNSDNSGSLTYVTVDYAGDAFDTQTDLNGIGFQSVGSATTVNHIQVNNNVDDGVEFYGGAVDVSNIVLTENGDDSFDCTEGWAGSADKVLIIQSGNSDTHDRAFECDNNKSPNTASPQTTGTVSNVTIIRDLNNVGAEPDLVKIRRGSALSLSNVVISSPIDQGACFDITDGDGDGAWSGADVGGAFATLTNVLHNCFERDDTANTVAWLDTDNAGEVASGTLTLDGYINGATENSAGVGAVACGDVWTLGWTLAGTLPASSTEEYCSNAVDVPVMGWAGLVALFGGLAGVTRLARRVK